MLVDDGAGMVTEPGWVLDGWAEPQPAIAVADTRAPSTALAIRFLPMR